MRTAAWFIVSELLLVFTIVLVFSNWHGNVNFALGFPLSGSTLTINGGAQGGAVLLAFASALLTIATFVMGSVRLVRSPRKREVQPIRTSAAADVSSKKEEARSQPRP